MRVTEKKKKFAQLKGDNQLDKYLWRKAKKGRSSECYCSRVMYH